MNEKLLNHWADYFVCSEYTGVVRPIKLQMLGNDIEGCWYIDHGSKTYDPFFVDESFSVLVERMRSHFRREMTHHQRNADIAKASFNLVEDTVTHSGEEYVQKSRGFARSNAALVRVHEQQRQGASRSRSKAKRSKASSRARRSKRA